MKTQEVRSLFEQINKMYGSGKLQITLTEEQKQTMIRAIEVIAREHIGMVKSLVNMSLWLDTDTPTNKEYVGEDELLEYIEENMYFENIEDCVNRSIQEIVLDVYKGYMLVNVNGYSPEKDPVLNALAKAASK